MERVDLDHARREADSLKRFAEREGKQDLAEFAAMTRALVAELEDAQEVVGAAKIAHRRLVRFTETAGIGSEYLQQLDRILLDWRPEPDGSEP
jgi:hypothetical protein